MTKENYDIATKILQEKDRISELIDLFKNANMEGGRIASLNAYGDVLNDAKIPSDLCDKIVSMLFTRLEKLNAEFEKI